MKSEYPKQTTHCGQDIWLTKNGHKLRRTGGGAFTLAQARRYDLHHPPEKVKA